MEPTAFSGPVLASLAFFVVTLGFVGFVLVASYHWFRYGYNRKVALLSLAAFLLPAAALLLTMAVALYYM